MNNFSELPDTDILGNQGAFHRPDKNKVETYITKRNSGGLRNDSRKENNGSTVFQTVA